MDTRVVRRCLVTAMVAMAVALSPAAQGQVAVGAAPATFDVNASAAPVLVAISAPSALPLDVAAGIGFSGAKLNSQPKGTAEAAPGYIPLAGALPLLGGPGALPGIAARLLPGLLVGLPTVFGLPPVPIDPTVIAVPPIPVLPAPPLPALECFASVPGDTAPVTCGGPTQDALGFKVAAASGVASATGNAGDLSTLRVDTAVKGGGLSAAPENTLLPLTAAAIASSASAYVKDGRIVGAASTAVQDFSIAGAIKIPLMETSISAALDGTPGNAAVHGERCTITGATVAGVPVTIDGEGVHLADQTSSLGAVIGPLNELVQRTLDQLGITLKTAARPADPGAASATTFPGAVSLSKDGTKVAASLACLEVGYKVPTSGLTASLTIGSASVVMQAFGAATAAEGPIGSITDTGTGAGLAAPTTGGELSLPPLGSGGGAAPPAAPAAGAGAPAPSTAPFQRVDFGWKIPYAPFGFLALALPLAVWTRRIGPLPVGRAIGPVRRLRGAIGAVPLPRPALPSGVRALVRRLRP